MGVFLLLAALAQSPADRATLESLRDSLELVADSAALHRLEAVTIGVAKQRRSDPLIHLRLGFIGYRLGEITKTKSHYDDAAGEFEWAAELQPDWPYPWYGLGLAELALGESSSIALENLRQMLGKDYLSKAARLRARDGGRPGVLIGGRRPRQHRAHAAHSPATRGRAERGPPGGRRTGRPARRRAARARARGARGR